MAMVANTTEQSKLEMSFIIGSEEFAMLFFLPSWHYFSDDCLKKISVNLKQSFFTLIGRFAKIREISFENLLINDPISLIESLPPILIAPAQTYPIPARTTTWGANSNLL